MKNQNFKPESLMMSHGYNPQLSEGAVKCPIFQTSTFAFKSAEEGKAFFEVAYGLRDKKPDEEMGLIYSRINNPDLEILEDRLCLWDQADVCAVFESGMSAITTVMLEFLKPGDLLLHSKPVYGGTSHFIAEILPQFGIKTIGFHSDHEKDEIIQKVQESGAQHKLKLIFVETPANPTNSLIDLQLCKEIADYFTTETNQPVVAVDNTYMGPLWCQPLTLGADLVIYSATKYIGGHSDLIAGAVLGSEEHMIRIKVLRTFLGNMSGPWTGWLLMRSLETLKPRMELQAANAAKVANFLKDHPKVEKVFYLGHLNPGSKTHLIFEKQYSSPGAMISVDIKGGEKAAFTFLNHLKLFHLAVSLGSTESLAQHPYSMTHADVPEIEKNALGLTDKMVRLSIGVENSDDLIWDVTQALDAII